MKQALLRLTALCMLSAFGEQMTPEAAGRDGVRLIAGLAAAELILEMVISLFTGG